MNKNWFRSKEKKDTVFKASKNIRVWEKGVYLMRKKPEKGVIVFFYDNKDHHDSRGKCVPYANPKYGYYDESGHYHVKIAPASERA